MRLKPTLSVLAAAALCAAAAGSVAQAADPAEGTVSHATPTVSWSGTVVNSYLAGPAESGGAACTSPICDAFTLHVADQDDLAISADAPAATSGSSTVYFRVHKPDGSTVDFTGDSSGKPVTGKIKNAVKGDYVVDYHNSFVGSTDYNASATLGKPAAPATPAPPAVDAPPPPAPLQDLSVTAKVGKLSARKLAKSRKLVVTVTVSRAVKSVAATLTKGSKKVGAGKLGAISGTAKLTIKVGKLKKGSYALALLADDGAGVQATRTLTVKVVK